MQTDVRMKVAKKMIEALANHHGASAAELLQGEPEKAALARLFAAARENYSLPSYCSENAADFQVCLRCIIDFEPLRECVRSVERLELDELDLVWEGQPEPAPDKDGHNS